MKCDVFHFFYRQDLPQAALPVFHLLTADFGVFRIIVIFCTTCIAREVFSLVIMRNVTTILPVSQ